MKQNKLVKRQNQLFGKLTPKLDPDKYKILHKMKKKNHPSLGNVAFLQSKFCRNETKFFNPVARKHGSFPHLQVSIWAEIFHPE